MRRFALVMLLGLAACGKTELKTPDAIVTEEVGGDTTSAGELKPSYVSSPIVFDLRPVLAELEVAVPHLMGSIEKDRRIKVMGTPSVSVAPELRRHPFKFDFEQNTVTVSTVIEYRARAWATIFKVSCGMDEPRPRMRVKLAITYSLTPDWHLSTHSRVLELEPVSREERDQCEISAAKIDVTPKIASAARGAVDGALKKLDAKLARITVRPPVERLWLEIQKPISISEGRLWLDIGPKEIFLGPITATDSTLVARLDLLANPRIIGGDAPPADSLPLPNLGKSKATVDTADVYMDGLLTWTAADQILAKELVGKTIGKRLRKITIDSVGASPAGGGRILLEAKVRGAANGIIYVVGTPVYDSTTDLITFPDLAFDANSMGYLVQAASWLANGPFVDQVRAQARIPASRLMEEVIEIANKELDRQRLAEGVDLRGQLSGARVESIRVTREGLRAVGRGTGRLSIEISKSDLVPEVKIRRAGKKPAKKS